jgi:hypothetical protein
MVAIRAVESLSSGSSVSERHDCRRSLSNGRWIFQTAGAKPVTLLLLTITAGNPLTETPMG